MSEITGTTTQGSAETTSQTQEGGETAQSQGQGTTGAESGSAGGAVSDAAKEAARKFKIKYQDGKEEEVDEDTVLKTYRERKGHQAAANKKLQEGTAARKQAEEFIAMMKDKKKFFETAGKLGHDPRKLAEEFLAEQLQDEMMDPRERELRDAKNRLKTYEELEKQQREAVEKQRMDALKAKFSDEYTKQFVDALKSTNIPQNKETVAEMAKYIHRASKIGFEMTAKEAAQLVKEDIENRHRSLYGEADAETLVKILGDQGLQKIRSFDTSRLKSPADNLRTPQEQPEIGTRKKTGESRMSQQEWRAFNRK